MLQLWHTRVQSIVYCLPSPLPLISGTDLPPWLYRQARRFPCHESGLRCGPRTQDWAGCVCQSGICRSCASGRLPYCVVFSAPENTIVRASIGNGACMRLLLPLCSKEKRHVSSNIPSSIFSPSVCKMHGAYNIHCIGTTISHDALRDNRTTISTLTLKHIDRLPRPALDPD